MKLFRWISFCFDIFLSNFGLLKRPFRLFLVVTKRCSSRCTNCKIWAEPLKQELTLPEYEKIARHSTHIKWLNLTGGEPTDREDLVEIVAVFVRHCKNLCIVNFTTNGLRPELIEAKAKSVLALGIPKVIINVSIDGPPAVNDSLRGVAGDFNSAVETLKRLRKLPGLSCSLAMTLYAKNSALIFDCYQAVREKIGDFELNEMHLNYPHGSSHYYRNAKLKLPRDPGLSESIIEFHKRLGKPKRLLELFERSYQKHLLRYIETGRTPVTCSSLVTSVYVSEVGDIFPCTIWDRKVGSLRESDYDLMTLFKSSEASSARQAISKQECPNCWSPCEAFPSLMSNALKIL